MKFHRRNYILLALFLFSGLPSLFMVQPAYSCSSFGPPPESYLVIRNNYLETIKEIKLEFSNFCVDSLLKTVDDSTILLRNKQNYINLFTISNLLSDELTPIQSYNFSDYLDLLKTFNDRGFGFHNNSFYSWSEDYYDQGWKSKGSNFEIINIDQFSFNGGTPSESKLSFNMTEYLVEDANNLTLPYQYEFFLPALSNEWLLISGILSYNGNSKLTDDLSSDEYKSFWFRYNVVTGDYLFEISDLQTHSNDFITERLSLISLDGDTAIIFQKVYESSFNAISYHFPSKQAKNIFNLSLNFTPGGLYQDIRNPMLNKDEFWVINRSKVLDDDETEISTTIEIFDLHSDYLIKTIPTPLEFKYNQIIVIENYILTVEIRSSNSLPFPLLSFVCGIIVLVIISLRIKR